MLRPFQKIKLSMADARTPTPAEAGADEAIRWHGIFAAPELELRYRTEQMVEDLSRIRLVVGVTIIGFLVYIWNDFYFSGNEPAFKWLLLMRASVLLFSIVVLVKLLRGITVHAFDRIVLAWWIVSLTALLYVSSAHPEESLGNTIVAVLFVLLTYLAVPLPVLWQTCSAGITSAGILALGFWIKPWADDHIKLSVLISLFTANALGAGVSRELQVWRRRQFAALCRERDLSAILEKALGEIKTLQGILPICMHCKRVRNDEGYWEQVEVYVSEHTKAEFSHGLCPNCARTMYPEIDWDKARSRVTKSVEPKIKPQ
jgi:hypothetical protein